MRLGTIDLLKLLLQLFVLYLYKAKSLLYDDSIRYALALHNKLHLYSDTEKGYNVVKVTKTLYVLLSTICLE